MIPCAHRDASLNDASSAPDIARLAGRCLDSALLHASSSETVRNQRLSGTALSGHFARITGDVGSVQQHRFVFFGEGEPDGEHRGGSWGQIKPGSI